MSTDTGRLDTVDARWTGTGSGCERYGAKRNRTGSGKELAARPGRIFVQGTAGMALPDGRAAVVVQGGRPVGHQWLRGGGRGQRSDRAQLATAEATKPYLQAQDRYGKAGTLTGEAECLWGLAEIARMQERHVEATELYRQALERFKTAETPYGKAVCVVGLALVAKAREDRAGACRLFAEAEALFRQIPDETGLRWVVAEQRRLGCGGS